MRDLRAKVLLVDDDVALLGAYARILRADGYDVVEATSGEAVEELLETDAFDVVVTDLTLPHANGIAVLQAVHLHDPDLRVALMTGDGDLATATQAMEHGALRYLLKPVPPSVLARTIDEGVESRRRARVAREALSLLAESSVQRATRDELHRSFARSLERIQMV